MISTIYKLDEQNHMERVATYSVPPKQAMVNYIMQFINKNFNTWEYPEIIKGMRQSKLVPSNWYYDNNNEVLAAYEN